MRQRLLITAVLTGGLILSGCGINPSKPTPQQMDAADYGAIPIQYEAAIHKYFADTLKDPDSAQYRSIAVPEKGFVTTRPYNGYYKFTYGWLVNVNINSKNSYGGYIGYKDWSFLFRGEEIMNVQSPDTPPVL